MTGVKKPAWTQNYQPGVPAEIDDGVARVKLETLGITIDELTEEQIAYMNSWNF